ncbi:MAG: phenylacetate--CoA ligase, partial [candidate division KSB1 bacterium]|nr:phenylacetate--CoA ligase [candidate division KSB1 bacterium]
MKYIVEYIDPELLYRLQLERLRDVALRLYQHVPYYRGAFDAIGMKPQDIQSLDDLQHLPLTDKETLRTNYPFGMFAV